MMVTMIPREYLHQEWGKVAKYLEKATRTVRLRADVADLYQACLLGQQQLWIVFDEEDDNRVLTGFVTQILEYPRYKALAVQFLGGERMKEWLDLALNRVCEYGTEVGCETVEGYGREAWIRWLKPRGFKKTYAVFEKELE